MPKKIDLDTIELPDDGACIEEARAQYAEPSDDNIEIDDQADVSRVRDGAWVQAYVFVALPDLIPEMNEMSDAQDEEMRARWKESEEDE